MDKNFDHEDLLKLRDENERLRRIIEKNSVDCDECGCEHIHHLRAHNYQKLVDSCHDIIFTSDAQGVFTFVSNAWEKILGHAPTEVIGKPFHFYVHPDFYTKAMAFITTLAEKGEAPDGIEYKVKHIDGSWRWHRTMANPLYDRNGAFCGLEGIARDITDFKKNLRKLSESSQLLNNVTRNMFDTVIIAEFSGNITYCSESIAQLGYSVNELIGKNVFELTHPEDYAFANDAFVSMIQHGVKKQIELRYRGANGNYYWYEIIGQLLGEEKNNGTRKCIFSCRNIHDRKLAEEALKRSEAKYQQMYSLFRLMVDTMPDMLWAKDLNNKFLFANKAFCENLLMAESIGEPFGKTDMFFALRERNKHPENPDWHTFGELCIDSDSITLQEMRPRQFDEYGNVRGKFLFLNVHKAPLFNETGELIGVVGSAQDITQHKEAEKVLEETRETYQGIFNSLTEAIYILDETGSFIEVNKGAEIMYGFSREELIGQSPLTVAAPGLNKLDEILGMMSQVPVTGKPVRFEFWACRKNGEIFPKDVIVSKGKYFGKDVLIATARDITIQKQWEESLMNYKQRMQLAADAARFGVWEYDLVRHTLIWDDWMLKLYGVQREDFAGDFNTYQRFLHPDDLERAKFEEKLALEEANELLTEFRIIRPDGEVRHLRVAAIILRDAENNPIRVTGINYDVTERNLAEIQLRKSEANMKAIIENTTDNIWAVDTNYNLTYINENLRREYLKAFGVSLKAGDNKVENIPEAIRHLWKSRYDKALKNEQFAFEDLVPTEQGITYINVSMNPILVDNEVIGVSCFGSNITARKLAEQELLEAKNRAEESDRLKSAFLANMSHEIRTPMNGILGFAELLKEPGLTGEEQQDYIKIIEKSGSHMLNIINDIVDISRIEAGLMKIDIHETNINEQIEYIYTFFKPEVEAKGIRLYINYGLPSKAAIIKTDREKVFAILTNLVKNAIKYSRDGSIEVGYVFKRISAVGEIEVPAKLEFYVKDTGIGIPKDYQEAIFERFMQADIPSKMTRQGTGLGLAITKSYVEMLGGKIWVDSDEGKGSTFYFTLPCNAESKD